MQWKHVRTDKWKLAMVTLLMRVPTGNGCQTYRVERYQQGCVVSPWLFNLSMDIMVREVNARILKGRSMYADC